MNILTFDIEEWYIEKCFYGNRQAKYDEYDAYLDDILDILDKNNIKATFFCLGKMALEYGWIVKKIHSRGHEIGCHSDRHTWLNKMSRLDTLLDTRSAVDSIEQCIGEKVLSYRAPAFSVGEENKWAFEVLKECGIECDASVFPARRDFGGFPSFGYQQPVRILCNGIEIKEFPLCMTSLLNRSMAYSGGGYFRFFPYWFIKRTIMKSDYVMAYFHIGDLIPDSRKMYSKEEYEEYFKENGTLFKRITRYAKSNVGKSNSFKKMGTLVGEFPFESISQAVRLICWENTPIVQL